MQIWSVQLLHILESEYKVTKDCADTKVGQLQPLNISGREYKVTKDCADAKVGQFSFYRFRM